MVYNLLRSDDSIELSREVSRYIAFRKLEKSRKDQIRSMVDTAVAVLEASGQDDPPPHIAEVKDMLDDRDNKLYLAVIPEVEEGDKETWPAGKECRETQNTGREAKAREPKDKKHAVKDTK